jgi:major membrane immunogen (membrane-anchored lipoprotein)
MTLRLLSCVLLLVVALLPSACASSADTADDSSTFQAAPEKSQDDHGWGASVQGLSGRQ